MPDGLSRALCPPPACPHLPDCSFLGPSLQARVAAQRHLVDFLEELQPCPGQPTSVTKSSGHRGQWQKWRQRPQLCIIRELRQEIEAVEAPAVKCLWAEPLSKQQKEGERGLQLPKASQLHLTPLCASAQNFPQQLPVEPGAKFWANKEATRRTARLLSRKPWGFREEEGLPSRPVSPAMPAAGGQNQLSQNEVQTPGNRSRGPGPLSTPRDGGAEPSVLGVWPL